MYPNAQAGNREWAIFGCVDGELVEMVTYKSKRSAETVRALAGRCNFKRRAIRTG